ncbi:hypothetical protein KM792_13305 [Clostridium tyrobutyricum]|uniref:hypothetical protein n=1 Tax=Clostridium tyrobutyricum TaxID=1519 RepID=UPI001C3914F0|nr:hypothetical protein [Clostridium tyrobutyricum]MBV4450623.1 hypothetical protein [Clostridium tyrobutyricum]
MSYTKGQELIYNPNGKVQTLNLQGIKKVKIECWGGRGGYGCLGTSNFWGGYGDCCIGELNLTNEEQLQIYPGNMGDSLIDAGYIVNQQHLYQGRPGESSYVNLDSMRIITSRGGYGGDYSTKHYSPDKNFINDILSNSSITSNSSISGKIIITIEEVNNNKYLIKQDNKYYSIKDNTLTELGIPIDDVQKEQWFNDYGIDDLKEALLTYDENGEKLIDSLDDKFEVRMMVPKD